MAQHSLNSDGRYPEAVHYLSRERHAFSFSPSHLPAMTVRPGEMIQVQTHDCYAGRLFVPGLSPDGAASMSFEDDDVNPATGPIYVEGAMPGDVLSVSIHHIHPGRRGVARTYAGVGQLHEAFPRPHAQFFDVDADGKVVTMNSRVSFPCRPMMGVIGVAPRGTDPVPTMPAGRHGGNLDDSRNGIGSIVHLAVNHPGALLSVGDMHACMGDGEVCGTGVEVGGDVLLSVSLRKGLAYVPDHPVTELDDRFVTHGVSDGDINAAIKIACEEAAGILVNQWSFSPEEAYVFLSVRCDVGVCQNVHPCKGTVIARCEVPKLAACPGPFNVGRAAGRTGRDVLLYEALSHFVVGGVGGDDLGDYEFEPTSGGVNNVVYYVTKRKGEGEGGRDLVGVLRVYNNSNDDPKVEFEHRILELLGREETLSFAIPETIPSARGGRNFVKLSTGASACLFRAIGGGLPKLSKVREIGLCAGELSMAMGRIDRDDVPSVCPTHPYWDIYRVHRAVTKELFYETLRSHQFDPWRVWADEVEDDLIQVEGMLGSYGDILHWSFIHGDLHYDNILVDDGGVTGLLDFEFAAYDWRAMELAICLSKYCSEGEPLGYFERFVDGFAVHGELTRVEMESMCVLIRLRILSNVVYFVGRALSGEDGLSTLTSRIETYCKRLRWLKTNESEIVCLIKEKFVANNKL